MKHIFKTILLLFVFASVISCQESDLQIDTLYNEVDTSGAVLRILEYPSDIVDNQGEIRPNSIDFITEVQQGDGSFTPEFVEVRVYVSVFYDQDLAEPLLDSEGNELGEVLLQTIPASSFDELSDINNLPMTSISYTTQSIHDAYTTGEFGGVNFVVTRFELEMNDGRIWTDTNAGTALSGPFFEAPFIYRTIYLNN
ncbi:MAG: hypothetical protein ACWA45_08335 [Flavobacteriales bacterium]